MFLDEPLKQSQIMNESNNESDSDSSGSMSLSQTQVNEPETKHSQVTQLPDVQQEPVIQ
jgi:hypothetical protein